MGDELMQLHGSYGLAITAALLTGLAIVTPSHAATQARVLGAITLAAAVAWLATASRRESDRKSRAAARTERKTRRQLALPRRPPRYAAVDAAAYGLRIPYDAPDLGGAVADAREAGLSPVLRRAVRLGTRIGNRAASVRLVAAMADFSSRHRLLMGSSLWRDSSDPQVAALQVRAAHELDLMRESRRVALDTVQELTMRVPGGDIARAYATISERIARDTFRRMDDVYVRWHACMPVRMAAAASGCGEGPTPEPYQSGRSNMLFQ
jgi:hypothetical protein